MKKATFFWILAIVSLLDWTGSMDLTYKKCSGVYNSSPCGRAAFCNLVTRYCEKCSVVCRPESATTGECQGHCPKFYKKMVYKAKYPELITTAAILKVNLKVTEMTENLNNFKDESSFNSTEQVISSMMIALPVLIAISVVVMTAVACLLGYKAMKPKQFLKQNLSESFHRGQNCDKKEKDSSLGLAGEELKPSQSKHTCVDVTTAVISASDMLSPVHTSHSTPNPRDTNTSSEPKQSNEQLLDTNKTDSGVFSGANQSTRSNDAVSNSGEYPANNHTRQTTESENEHTTVNSNANNNIAGGRPVSDNHTVQRIVNPVAVDNKNLGVPALNNTNPFSAANPPATDNVSDAATTFQFDVLYSSHMKPEEPPAKPVTFTEQPLSHVRRNGDITAPDNAPVLQAIRSKSGSHQVAEVALENVNVRHYSGESGYNSAERETLLKGEPAQVNRGLAVPIDPPLFPEVQPHPPVQETQPLLGSNDVTKKTQQRPQHPNRRIYDLLKGIDWVEGYYSEGQSIEVYCDLHYISEEVALKELGVRTGAGTGKFHIKENAVNAC